MQMPPLFEEKTGKFVGLDAEQAATLNPQQLKAYNDLADATVKLAAADKKAVEARDHHHAVVRKLQEAEAKKKQRWTPHDEWRAMVAAGRGLPTDKELLKGAMVRVQMQGKELTRENLLTELPPGFQIEIDGEDGPSLFDLQEALSESTVQMHAANQRQRDARGCVASCITQWQIANQGTPTFESLIRQHIEAQNAERQARADGLIPPRGYKGGNSQVDRMAAAMSGGSGPGPVRMPDGSTMRGSGMARAGGGNAFRRGAFTKAEAARENARRAREAAAGKVKP